MAGSPGNQSKWMLALGQALAIPAFRRLRPDAGLPVRNLVDRLIFHHVDEPFQMIHNLLVPVLVLVLVLE